MADIKPTLRYLILCEDVVTDPAFPRRVTLVGLLSAIRSVEDPPYPLLYQEICVFAQFTECRAAGDVRVEVAHADTGKVVFRTRSRTVNWSDNPLDIHSIVFRLRNCLFEESGLYWVQLWYNNEIIEQQALVLK